MPIADIDYREYFPPERIEQLLAEFNKYDTDGRGSIGEKELALIFKNLGKNLTRRELHEIMKEVDIDRSGDIQFEELCVLEIKMSRARPRADLIDYRDYLDAKTIRQLEQLFVQMDPFCRGSIGITELHSILEIQRCNASNEDIDAAVAEVDTHNCGEIEFDKLGAIWAVLTHARKHINYREFLNKEQVLAYRQMFEMADSRGQGCISCVELNHILKSLGCCLKKNQLTALFHDFDTDGSGDIDFEEFCVMMLRLKGVRRKREVNPETCCCRELWAEECFSIRELQQSGFGLEEFRSVGIPVNKIYHEGKVSALELRRAGYTPKELRRGGLSVTELRTSGFSLADLRNAGFSDSVLSQTNRELRSSLSTGDLSKLPQSRPESRADGFGVGKKTAFSRPQSAAVAADGGLLAMPAPWEIPPRQMTPMLREHTDWRPKLNRNKQFIAAGAEMMTMSIPTGPI